MELEQIWVNLRKSFNEFCRKIEEKENEEDNNIIKRGRRKLPFWGEHRGRK